MLIFRLELYQPILVNIIIYRYVVVLLGSVVFVDSLSPVVSSGVVSTGVLVSVEGVVVLSEV